MANLEPENHHEVSITTKKVQMHYISVNIVELISIQRKDLCKNIAAKVAGF